MDHFSGKCDKLKTSKGKPYKDTENEFYSIFQEQEELNSRGVPYWYKNYIQYKRQQQLRIRNPLWIEKSIEQNSDLETDAPEKNVTRIQTSSESENYNADSYSPNKQQNYISLQPNDLVLRLTSSQPTKPKTETQDTNLPNVVSIRRSISFPRSTPSRKVDNINLVLPRQVSPPRFDQQVSEVSLKETDSGLTKLKRTDAKATEDLIFADSADTAELESSRELIDEDNMLSPMTEWTMPLYKTISFNSLSSDKNWKICNILATSTPLSSTHALNVLIEKKKKGKKLNTRWISKLKTIITNSSSPERRKSQPLATKSSKASAESLSSSTPKFFNFIKLFRKVSPKKRKSKKNISMMMTQKVFLPVSTKRFSLDPQTISSWNKMQDEYCGV